jgi:hypothetical protein
MLMEGLEKYISFNILATSSNVAHNQTEGNGYTRVTKQDPTWWNSSLSDIQKISHILPKLEVYYRGRQSLSLLSI